jgi:hypothetical protein
VHARVDGANYGAVLRFNEAFAIGYNYAQSFRISTGEGNLTHRVGERQGVPVGEGSDLSARVSLFKGRIEFTAVYYDNFRPNDRFNPNPNAMVENEVAVLFPETFLNTGQDFQTTTTKGYELAEASIGARKPSGVTATTTPTPRRQSRPCGHPVTRCSRCSPVIGRTSSNVRPRSR